ncbi:MAG: flavin reductase family protein [Endomicrobiia bacterium]
MLPSFRLLALPTRNKKNLTHECICECKKFTISILNKNTPLKFVGTFGFKSGRDIDKFEGINYKIGITGLPVILDYSLAYIELETISSLDVGTHTIFIGKVVDAQILNDSEPMTYAYYHEVKRGTTSKNAPTYINLSKEVK